MIETSRRAVLLGLGAASLASCMGMEKSGLMGKQAQLIGAAFRRPRKMTREEVAKYPAASIAVGLAGGRGEALVLLNRIEGRDLYWLSIDKVMIVTRGGRVMSTGGLNYNLAHTTLPVPDPVDGALLRSDGVKSLRHLDYDDFGPAIEARSRFRVARKETLAILGARIPTVKVREHVRVKALKWRFTNTYWAHEATGEVWASRQHVHPDGPALLITVMRPAAIPGA